MAVDGAGKYIAELQAALGATVLKRHDSPDGRVMHSLIQIGDSRIMLSDSFPGMDWKPTVSRFYLYVADCDATYNKAIAAGLKSVQALADQFYGDRHGAVQDSAGNQWWISTHKEDLSAPEMAKRSAEHTAKMKPSS
jgi:PhnB protein